MKPLQPDRLRGVVDDVIEAGFNAEAFLGHSSAVPSQFTAALVRRIRDRHEWDDVFLDALRTSPVSFTLGSVIVHILTVAMVRRQTGIDALRELGVRDVESRDPIEWEREVAVAAHG